MNKKILSTVIGLALTTSVVAVGATDTRIVSLTKGYAKVMQEAQLSVAKEKAESMIASTSQQLDLASTIDHAIHQNHDVQMAIAAYKEAQANVGIAAANKLPAFGYTYVAGRKEVMVSPQPKIFAIGNRYTNSLSVTLPLYTGGKVEGSIRGAEYLRDIAGAKAEKALQTVRLEAAKAYFGLLQVQNKCAIADMQVADLAAHKKQVDALYRVGVVAKSDVLATEVEVAKAETTSIQAKNGVALAKANLNFVMAWPADHDIVLTDIEFPYKTYTITEKEAQSYAVLHRPDVLAAVLGVEAAKAGVQVAKSGYLPIIGLSAQQDWVGESPWPKENAGWSVGAKATWKLWDGGATENQLKAAKAKVEYAKVVKEKALEGVVLEVRKAYLTMKAAEAMIASTKVAVEQGKENYRIASLRYQAGVGTNLDVLDAELKLQHARNEYIDALYTYNLNVATLENAIGVDGQNVMIGSGLELAEIKTAPAELEALMATIQQ